MKKNRLITVLAITGCIMYTLTVTAEDQKSIELSRYFEQYDYGCIAILDTADDSWQRHNPSLCAKPMSPASTFKIYNSLIALETGAADGPQHLIKWDGVDRGRQIWNRDHTLESAVRNSALWYFEEIARRIGPENMSRYLQALPYGNNDISGWTDPFWLGSSLKISPDKQVMLLKRLLTGQTPFSPVHVETVKNMLSQEHIGYPELYGKTGSVILPTEARLGWFVGFLPQEEDYRLFAVVVLGPEGTSGMMARDTLVSILTDMDLLPIR